LDERILIFFAGHGHTVSGFRGEVGYLVPYDANPSDLSTLIRWQELTGNSELIRAKHMLFIMDACYGGLALTRSLHPGSVRFLKDMTQRYSRQVLTAGKADEVVSDAGGPLPNHSVFTGHLLEGMRGAAANSDGVLTASTLMAYVYTRVAQDRNSNQTPHYGYFDGDGDFVLKATELLAPTNTQVENDQAYVVPFIEEEPLRNSMEHEVEKTKHLLSNDSSVIELHDSLVRTIQQFLSASAEDNFALQATYSDEQLVERIAKYEEITKNLRALEACLAYWAKHSHFQILQKVLARSTDRLEIQSGVAAWVHLRWYPIILQLYSSGIAAIAGGRYDSLATIFRTKVTTNESGKHLSLVDAVSQAILDLNRSNVFKRLPGRANNYVPMSEHLFKLLQPELDEILFLGKDYERTFNEFEVLFGLAAADSTEQASGHVWGPIGRFGYKARYGDEGPLAKTIAEAVAQTASWGPLRAGMFGGDLDRFRRIAEKYNQMVSGLHWY
jgi:hypothetical protein